MLFLFLFLFFKETILLGRPSQTCLYYTNLGPGRQKSHLILGSARASIIKVDTGPLLPRDGPSRPPTAFGFGDGVPGGDELEYAGLDTLMEQARVVVDVVSPRAAGDWEEQRKVRRVEDGKHVPGR